MAKRPVEGAAFSRLVAIEGREAALKTRYRVLARVPSAKQRRPRRHAYDEGKACEQKGSIAKKLESMGVDPT